MLKRTENEINTGTHRGVGVNLSQGCARIIKQGIRRMGKCLGQTNRFQRGTTGEDACAKCVYRFGNLEIGDGGAVIERIVANLL